ncbi:hypothetical protein SRABI134_00329 [Peribacillus sp. Bi134]|jgi:hypothetical protein|nr:hypothetical protein SRABI134_00329 [Peribacillus sp. Bi134]
MKPKEHVNLLHKNDGKSICGCEVQTGKGWCVSCGDG